MTYLNQLHPWCIIRILPNLQQLTIARFRRRGDAEAHLRILRQNGLTLHYAIVFDPNRNPSNAHKEAESKIVASQKESQLAS